MVRQYWDSSEKYLVKLILLPHVEQWKWTSFGNLLKTTGRIGRFSLIGDLQEVARRVAQTASQQESDEELIAIAPEEFLDPIMSTIMMNPVILPSSKIVVDRATIAR